MEHTSGYILYTQNGDYLCNHISWGFPCMHKENGSVYRSINALVRSFFVKITSVVLQCLCLKRSLNQLARLRPLRLHTCLWGPNHL
jgi:hypothetical protein